MPEREPLQASVSTDSLVERRGFELPVLFALLYSGKVPLVNEILMRFVKLGQ